MGLFSKPSVPDYAGAAAQQGQQNQAQFEEAWRWNHPDQNTPYGNESWGWDPQSGRWTRTTTLSDADQFQLNTQNNIENAALGYLADAMPGIGNAITSPVTWSGQPIYGFDPNYAPAHGYTDDTGMQNAPDLQTGLDFGGAPGMPTYGNADRLSASDAAYRLGDRYLTPQFDQRRQQQDVQMRNEGLLPGSEAYKNAMADLGREEMQARGDLTDRSILAGRGELESAYDRQMAGRKEGVAEIGQQGQFANDARQQYLAQMLADAGFKNNAVAQSYATAGQAAQLYNQARLQGIQELTTGRMLPINMITALLTGTQLQNPTFNQPGNAPAAEAAPIFQAAMAQGQGNLDRYNAQNALIGSFLSAFA